MTLRFAVYVHEPLTPSGWYEVDRNVSPDEAANLSCSWGARGWRVLTLSMECIEEDWEMNWPEFTEKGN